MSKSIKVVALLKANPNDSTVFRPVTSQQEIRLSQPKKFHSMTHSWPLHLTRSDSQFKKSLGSCSSSFFTCFHPELTSKFENSYTWKWIGVNISCLSQKVRKNCSTFPRSDPSLSEASAWNTDFGVWVHRTEIQLQFGRRQFRAGYSIRF